MVNPHITAYRNNGGKHVLISVPLLAVLICSQVRSEPVQSEPLVFEVASVKAVANAGAVSVTPRRSGDHISYITTLQMALCYAYDLQPFQLSGAQLPGTFDFEARAGTSADEKIIRQMFQSLLADRFGLRAHHENKETDIYTLLRGSKANQLKPADAMGLTSDPGAPSGRVDVYMQKSGPRLLGKRASMVQLAAGLSRVVRGPVVDRTGLVGVFDFDLDCSFDDPQEHGPVQPADLAWTVSRAITRLGLELKPARGLVDILVVEHVEQPHAN